MIEHPFNSLTIILLKSSNQITRGNNKTTISFDELCQISNKNINKMNSN